jgi:hypothetical protein
MDKPRIFDVGDDTFMDRYTVVIGEDVYGMSDNPLSPQGFNQYCCTTAELVGQNGVEVAMGDLPKDVQTAIGQRTEDGGGE